MRLNEIDLTISGTECICLIYDDQLPLNVPKTSDALLRVARRFSIAESGNSGLGMFAQADFQTGDLIWAENALVIVPEEEVPNIWENLSSRLSSAAQEIIHQLRNAHSPQTPEFEGCLRTNFIGIELSPSAGELAYRGLFPIISRANHSCCSNATYTFDTSNFSLELRAARVITVGEEIHVQYIDTLRPKFERQRLLRELYFFDCQCPSCILTDNSSASRLSDENRFRIRNWLRDHTSLEDWLNNYWLGERLIISESLELMDLIIVEGLEILQRFAIDMLCAALAANGDAPNFRKWALRARDAARMGGDSHPMVSYYNNAIKDSTSVPLWSARRVHEADQTLWTT